jgi:hypothetical protein
MYGGGFSAMLLYSRVNCVSQKIVSPTLYPLNLVGEGANTYALLRCPTGHV